MPTRPALNDCIHPTYLPYSREALRDHFSDERHIDQLQHSSERLQTYLDRYQGRTRGLSITGEVKRERQLERDERAWTISALKATFDASQLEALTFGGLAHFGADRGVTPGLGDSPQLRFEVGVPSPVCYSESLRERYERTDASVGLVPYISHAATGRARLESATRADAVVLGEKADLLIESKLLSDSSSSVRFDPFRNQIARNLDLLLEEKSPVFEQAMQDRYFLLLTPAVFRDRPRSRHYGMLLHEYVARPESLVADLPHRDAELVRALTHRIGWITFEDCRTLVPTACPWLDATN